MSSTTYDDILGNDELSKSIAGAWHNIKATWTHYEPQVKVLSRINNLFRKYTQVFSSLSKEPVISSPAAFLGRAFGCYLASVRMSASGQFSESCIMFRACYENALYGYYIHKKPELGEIWAERHKNEKAKSNARNKFKIGKILKTLTEQNPEVGKFVRKDYEESIDFGAHPNVYSVTCNYRVKGGKPAIAIFNNDPFIKEQCLLANIKVGLGCLSVFRLIYPEQMEKAGVPEELKDLYDRRNELVRCMNDDKTI